MTRYKFPLLAVFIILGFIFISFKMSPAPKIDDPIPYPEGYREWVHIKTYVVGPKSPAFKFNGGFNQVYANEKAMVGYKTGSFPNGSVIVSDVIQANVDSFDIREGPRHHIDVMVKDSIKYADKGGWTFEQFQGDSQTRLLTPPIMTFCTNCHKHQKDMVFSAYRK